MPSLSNPFRQDVNAALRQIEVEEQTRNELAQREAHRVTYYRPSHYIRLRRLRLTPTGFAVCFSLLFGAAAVFVWLCKLNHWWGLR